MLSKYCLANLNVTYCPCKIYMDARKAAFLLVVMNNLYKHAVYYARAQSPIGRYYALCYKRYGFKVEDELKFGLKSSCCNNETVMQMSAIDYYHVSLVLELIMLRSGILYSPDCEWSRVQIDCMLTAVGTR